MKQLVRFSTRRYASITAAPKRNFQSWLSGYLGRGMEPVTVKSASDLASVSWG
jgi:hypothetical protein